ALLGLIIGIVGVAVTLTSGIIAYRGRMRPVEPQYYSIPTGHGLALTLVVVGCVLTLAGLVIGYLGAIGF
ncbi:MAG TPA: hypothetical protein VIG35_09780, partial [Gaiellaceae bacterium]